MANLKLVGKTLNFLRDDLTPIVKQPIGALLNRMTEDNLQHSVYYPHLNHMTVNQWDIPTPVQLINSVWRDSQDTFARKGRYLVSELGNWQNCWGYRIPFFSGSKDRVSEPIEKTRAGEAAPQSTGARHMERELRGTEINEARHGETQRTAQRCTASVSPAPGKRGKYAPLHNHLNALTVSEWHTSFSELESILGFDLPASARRHRPWWANQYVASGRPQAHAWLGAGWKTQSVNLETETLVFVRET